MNRSIQADLSLAHFDHPFFLPGGALGNLDLQREDSVFKTWKILENLQKMNKYLTFKL
jgi:hypothetical protein